MEDEKYAFTANLDVTVPNSPFGHIVTLTLRNLIDNQYLNDILLKYAAFKFPNPTIMLSLVVAPHKPWSDNIVVRMSAELREREERQ